MNKSQIKKKLDKILPFNERYDKIFKDKLTLYYILKEYRQYLMKYYGLVIERDNKKILIGLPESKDKSLIEILEEVNELSIITSNNSTKEKISQLKKDRDNYYLDNKLVIIDEIIEYLDNDSLVVEKYNIENKILKLVTIKCNGSNSNFIENYKIDNNIKNKILEISNAFPEVEYMNFHIMLDMEKEFLIYKMTTGNDLYELENFSSELLSFIEFKEAEKEKPKFFLENIKEIMDKFLLKKGWQGYMYRNWLRGLIDDFHYRDVSISQKIWANLHGFFSYRIEQYGLTKSNYHDFLSDRDYKWLRNINNYYRKWLRDKIQFYYILKEYNKYLPKYYFHLMVKENKVLVFEYEKVEKLSSVNAILELLKVKHKLAMKPVMEAHGKGFYKLEYKNSIFFLNDKTIDEAKLKEFFEKINRSYLISEYVEMHSELKEFYKQVTGTVRMMVINTKGNNPKIVSSYLRVGNKRSGQVDNIANGGISVMLNHKTGDMLYAETLINHQYTKIGRHPDTRKRISGKIPNWEFICQEVEKICKYISPVEYLGIDLAVTDDGFKILEINMHQELHKYPEYDKKVKEYLNKKLEIKRKNYY